uniref:Uncharacterized protein n=1 Tax=Hyaloperonospora arabidopsidis (strain Emoy2) TaxID=559515 RepID=M4B315_HYAAE
MNSTRLCFAVCEGLSVRLGEVGVARNSRLEVLRVSCRNESLCQNLSYEHRMSASWQMCQAIG